MYDEEQEKLMAEEVILVDENDVPLGHTSKRESHLVENIRKGMLHRAFSVFLFNSEGKLLLQQRSAEKITFPLVWTNTCCSHPLWRDSEREEKNSLGAKRAAQRKLEHELGIPAAAISLEEFKFITRIHYSAFSDKVWGEHEVDHILLVKKDVELSINKNEVADYKYVSQDELRDLIENAEAMGLKLSPWFAMISDSFLFKWWDSIHAVDKIPSDNLVHKLKFD